MLNDLRNNSGSVFIASEDGYMPRYDKLYPELFEGLGAEETFSIMNTMADSWLEGGSHSYQQIKALTDIKKGNITAQESIDQLKAEIAETVKRLDSIS